MAWDFLLPLLTYPDRTPVEPIARAADFATTLGGSITTLSHQVDIPPTRNAVGSLLIDYPQMAAQAEKQSRLAGEELSQFVSTLANRLSLPLWQETFTSRRESAGDLLSAAARTHDCTLLPIDCESDEHRAVAEALLFQSGGPLVLFGPKDAPVHLDVVAVAWDGQRAASRALRDALPVLAEAQRVILLTSSDDKPIAETSVAAAISFLARHGVVARHEQAARGERQIGDALQESAIARGAGLLVMGGYGHNRIREFVLGGATRNILSDIRLPIFMSH